MKTQKSKVKMKYGIITLAVVAFIISGFTNPVSTSSEMESGKEVLSMLNNHSGLNYELGQTTISGRQEITVQGFENNHLNSLQIWLINQQHQENTIVVKNVENEYFIAERDVKPKIAISRIQKIIQSNLDYPKFADKLGEAGTVHVLFLVNEKGDVEKVITDMSKKEINVNLCESFEQCAERSIRATSGLWTPATINGKAVKKWMYVPVRFEFKS